MPFKSEAQRKKFASLVREGKMSQSTFDEWQAHTPKGKLPERVGKKKKGDTTTKNLKGRFGING